MTGYLPVTFDNLERGHERAVKWGPLERNDLRNHDDLKRAFVSQVRNPYRTGRACRDRVSGMMGYGQFCSMARAHEVSTSHVSVFRYRRHAR